MKVDVGHCKIETGRVVTLKCNKNHIRAVLKRTTNLYSTESINLLASIINNFVNKTIDIDTNGLV